MPFYLIEQRGVPGDRLVEAARKDSALKHVIEDAFTVTEVDGRALLDAAKRCEIEIAGVKPAAEPEPEILPGGGRVDGVGAPDPDAQRDDAQDRAMNEDEFGPIE